MKLLFLPVPLILCAAGCHRPAAVNETPVGTVVAIHSPLGLPPLPVPAENPETAETIALGRSLFYERMLSAGKTLSCASCHNPLLGFADGRRRSTGADGKMGIRNAPTVVNAAYIPAQFWDGRAPSLEEQAGGPMANSTEMNQSHEITVSKLQADPIYRANFERAFGPGPITIGKVKKALASFERTLLSGNSPFDRYFYGGDRAALTPAAIEGLALFRDKNKGNCAACHTLGEKYSLFTDGKFHNIGVGVNETGDLTDLGRYNETKLDRDKGAFKTPTLRNIALSAPYMHDGSLKTLQDVIEFYAGGGNSNPYLDPEMKTIRLTGPERMKLVSFLESLTGDMPPNAGPPETKSLAGAK